MSRATLHPNPEPWNHRKVQRVVTVPRCPIQTSAGTQCRNTAEGGWTALVSGDKVSVCYQHARVGRKAAS